VPEIAVLDTWATSSLTPQINARYGEDDDRSKMLLPMSMRTQAHEIIRTWAFYTIVRSLYLTGDIPWKDIMVCGFVLRKRGEKISKSKSNAESGPKSLITGYSADALRYWAASARLGTDTFFSEDDLSVSKRFLIKLWNASRFASSRLEDYEPSGIPELLLPVDRWIIERGRQTAMAAKRHLDRYEIGLARHEIDAFFWKDFCDNYLEIVKDRLYNQAERGEKERRSAQYALYVVLLNILKLYAVYVPHITEYIYQAIFVEKEGIKSLHLQFWDVPGETDARILRFGERLKEILSDVRKFKTENNMSIKEEIGHLTVDVGPELLELFRQSGEDIRACLRARSINFI
jgi:valyl-tRNA synthetase